MTIKEYRSKSLLAYSGVIILLWGLNFGFLEGFILADLVRIPYWWLVYVFLVPQSIFFYLFYLNKANNRKSVPNIGKIFIVTFTLRVFLSVIFLMPWLIEQDDSSKPMVIQFFYVFFPLLVVEITLLVRYLNASVQDFTEEE